MNKLISICIPTYQRPELLKEAIDSCLIQNYDPLEIIISDDSKDNHTENLVENLQSSCKIELRYIHNLPSLGQARNVNQLFDLARGGRLVLLHDDDLLLPNAIADLDNCWQQVPDLAVAFGKQYLISMTGEILARQSEELNQNYYRTPSKAGLQQSSMESALLQQFPNDGYMILSAAARSVRYREVNDNSNRYCDFDFGIQLSSKYKKFYFLHKYTAKYRITDTSISKTASPDLYMYKLVLSIRAKKSDEWARKKALERLAPQTIYDYAISRKPWESLQIFFSDNYRLRKRVSFQGAYLFLLILFPKIEPLLNELKATVGSFSIAKVNCINKYSFFSSLFRKTKSDF